MFIDKYLYVFKKKLNNIFHIHHIYNSQCGHNMLFKSIKYIFNYFVNNTINGIG